MPARSPRDPYCIDSGAKLREGQRVLQIGLVNNMPDGALEATERHFINLLNSADSDVEVRVSLYSLPGLRRTPAGQRHMERFYASTDALNGCSLDGLIMTGAEPLAADLRQEPYWDRLTAVVEWAEEHTYSAIWSCLAAHAAVLHLDGIERRRLSEKRFGVFQCVRRVDDPLTAGVSSCIRVPHSRWNDLAENDLADRGYRVLIRDEDGGVDAFLKQRRSLFVFFQGHPEYDTNTLLLEYRRDIGRYLKRERETYPEMPSGYFDEDAIQMYRSLREEILSDRRAKLPADLYGPSGGSIANTWSTDARRIYGNWLKYLGARKEQAQSERLEGIDK